MLRMNGAAGLILALFIGTAAAADHTPKIERGFDGLTAFAFEARNDGEAPIACAAAIAHWYSVELGRASLGQAVRHTLWFDPSRGVVFLIDKAEVRLPVETLWCGLEGRSWETRHVASLPSHTGEIAQAITLTCTDKDNRLICN